MVSVRNVAMWPDLEAAVGELHRIIRPGGTVIIAWHGGTKPSRVVKSLSLPEEDLRRIEHVLRDRFADVSRSQLATLDVFKAVRSR
jgi:SAM-dependent methyltransferase